MMSDAPSPITPHNTYIAEQTVDTLSQIYDGLSFLRDSFMTGNHGQSITLEYAARQGVILQLHSVVAAIDYEAQRLQHNSECADS